MGFSHIQNFLNSEDQIKLILKLSELLKQAPLFTPRMPRTGKKFSVEMTNFGSLGWVSDKENGYRYQPNHPETKVPWPEIPCELIKIWNELTDYPKQPEACLVNAYIQKSKMGLHQDKDEDDLKAPVVSISLGDTAIFRIGGQKRSDSTKSIPLQSGDIVILANESRLAFHGIDRIKHQSSTILNHYFPDYRRLNLTLRRVNH